MKKILATLFTILTFLCSLSAQVKPQPIQTAVIDGAVYVVELIPADVAQKNISAQLVQVNKQLETVERQMAELVAKRDELMKQKAALEFAQKQLTEAQAADEASKQAAPPSPPAPPKEKPKKVKDKN